MESVKPIFLEHYFPKMLGKISETVKNKVIDVEEMEIEKKYRSKGKI